MKLSTLLRLQVFYVLAGIAFNLASIAVIQSGGEALTSSDPYFGMIAMSIYGLFLMAGHYRKITLYRLLMVASILLLGYGGVFRHFFVYNETPELYHSLPVAIIGASINAYGLFLNVIAALGKFDED